MPELPFDALPVVINRLLRANMVVIVVDDQDRPTMIQCRLPELVERMAKGLPCPDVNLVRWRQPSINDFAAMFVRDEAPCASKLAPPKLSTIA